MKNCNGIISLLLIMLTGNTIHAQVNNDSIIVKEDPKIKFMIEIPFWLPGSNGNFSIGDISIDGDGEIKNVLSQYFKTDSKIDYYFVGKFGVRLNKWLLQGDVFGGQFRNTTTFSFEQIPLTDIELFTTMPRLFVGYQVFSHDFDPRPLKKRITIWPYAGCRYYHVNVVNNNNSVIPAFDKIRNWADPLIGFTVDMTLNRFSFLFENDFGGFGLGSDITYWVQMSAAYKVFKFMAFKLGWIYENINYNDTRHEESFRYKMIIHGPLAGIIFNF